MVVDAETTWSQREITMTEQRAGITLAFSYLYLFRRVVVSLAIVGAVLAWTFQLPALMAAFVCVGIGELLESSYYISVLRWRQVQVRRLVRLIPVA
jgi:hypothetical protein